MAEPKLLMPLGEGLFIDQVLEMWTNSVDRTAVVVRRSDDELARRCRRFDVELVQPEEDPPEMTDSVQHALRQLEASWSPDAEDCWLLAPADMPLIAPRAVEKLLEAYRADSSQAYVAVHDGKRGHPLLAGWPRAADVLSLSAGQTMRDAVSRWPVAAVDCGSSGVLLDVDTPEDYQKLLEQRHELDE